MHKEIYKRMYQGMRVIDAKHDIILRLTEDDAAKAIPKDPQNCALAVCAKRMFNVSRAIFFQTVAYIQLPHERTGEMEINRFEVPSKASRDIKMFDASGKIAEGGYHLLAPSHSARLDVQCEYAREYVRAGRKAKRKNAIIKGKIQHPTLTGSDPSWLRGDGYGMVQFSAIWRKKSRPRRA